MRAVALVEVGMNDDRLVRLLQLYIHEWSALIPVALGEDGLFVYDGIDPEGAAFLFVDGESAALLGFALIEPHTGLLRCASRAWSVTEFFVVAGERRRGTGRAAARVLFATHPGSWTLTVRPENPLALAFWRGVIPGAEERVELGDDGIARTRMTFCVAPDGKGRVHAF
jgi:predicted acetyltransferase